MIALNLLVHIEYVLDSLKKNGNIMDWEDYITCALKDGHNQRTIEAGILAAVGDVYGPKYKKEVEFRLDKLFSLQRFSA